MSHFLRPHIQSFKKILLYLGSNFKIQSPLFQICQELGKCKPWANTAHTHPAKVHQRSPWWLSGGRKPGRGGKWKPSSGSLFLPCTGTCLEPQSQAAKLRGAAFLLGTEGPGSQPPDTTFLGRILISAASSAPHPLLVSCGFVVPSTRDGIFYPTPLMLSLARWVALASGMWVEVIGG